MAGSGLQLSVALMTQSQPEFLLEELALPTEVQEQLWGVTIPEESAKVCAVIVTEVTNHGDTNTKPTAVPGNAASPAPIEGWKTLINTVKNPIKHISCGDRPGEREHPTGATSHPPQHPLMEHDSKHKIRLWGAKRGSCSTEP